MSEAPPEPVPAAVPSEAKDYWDIVFDQLAGRRLFKLGLGMLVLLYGLAIFAPVIANDRPYLLTAIDYQSYDQARKSLYPVALGLNGLVKKSPEEYLATRSEGSTQGYRSALLAERHAIAQRARTLRSFLPVEEHAALDELELLVESAIEAASVGERERARELGAQVKQTAGSLRAALAPRRPESDGSVPGVLLSGVTSYPLAESISALEVFFMLLWGAIALWPLWNRVVNRALLAGSRLRIRAWRRRKILAVLGLSSVGALAWHLTVGGEATFFVAPYKKALTAGDIVAERVLFPPLAFGFAETHLSETFRPPTWHAESEISSEGFYVRGARVPRADAVTGFRAEATPVEVRWGEPAANAALRHVLGTDSLGRDLFVRILWGARVSLSVGLVSTLILMSIGVVMGCAAGYFGGGTDIVISRIIEVVLCFPVFFLILVVVAFVGPSILNIMVVIGLLRWTGVARLGRAEFLRLKELDFVVAARATGLSTRRIVFRHMLPNAMAPLLVAGTFSVAAGILVESSLSFLGFGIQLPIPSWGSLVNETKAAAHWWIHLFPGLLIFVTVLSYNLVGDAIRDAMDPKLRT